jgi:hypothetical protein
MARPIAQVFAAVLMFVLLAGASIVVTNALFNAMASNKPSVTFSVENAPPGAGY